ncbi:MAG TPA: DUF1698 domain-containing protein, partial [Candidatus Thermoplasmatota archaeon]|nr:DUF1698 domain-containing protein [Candidatus Thermoplasmatota archaeon]
MAEATPQADIDALGPWLQDVRLPDGTRTAPRHPLGAWPQRLWDGFRHRIPDDLTGLRVLDVGCNAGYYCVELARRGATVVGLEPSPRYLAQAGFVVRQWGLEGRVELRRGQVYDLARGGEAFDLVLFLGVFYHLRYPLLALDVLARACRGRMYFQSLMTPGRPAAAPEAPMPSDVDGDLSALDDPTWPKLAFVEHELFGDATNRWVPNPQGAKAMLRSAGFDVQELAGGHVLECVRARPPSPWAQAEYLA